MLLRDIIDEHAPLKQRIIKHNQVPYMNNCELRKAMNVRNMLWRKFDKTPTKENWELYRKQRNVVVKRRKESKKKHLHKVSIGSNAKEFWENVKKTLLSNKSKNTRESMSLIEHDRVINDQRAVSNVLKQYYVNITEDLGQPETVKALVTTFSKTKLLSSNENFKMAVTVHGSRQLFHKLVFCHTI